MLEAGGLFVLGTERHESRRIDNQLRGRSGRQGDPGLSRFYLSLDDDLLRIFGPQTAFARLMNKNLEDGEAIVSPWISKAIETAQKKVEARNYDIRKQVVEFDDVMNDQRKVIYEQRAEIMDAENVSDVIEDMRAETIAPGHRALPAGHLSRAVGRRGPEGERRRGLGLSPPIDDWLQEEAVEQEIIIERLQAARRRAMAAKLAMVEPERWVQVEKNILLQTLDHHWKEHLATLDALRQVIHLRSYAQKKPIDEYKQEAFLLFERLLVAIREEVTRILMRAQVQFEEPPQCSAGGFCPTSSPTTSTRFRATTTRRHRRRGARRCFRACLRSTSRSPFPPRDENGDRRAHRSAATRHARAARAEVQALPRAAREDAPARGAVIDRTALRQRLSPDEDAGRSPSACQARLDPASRARRPRRPARWSRACGRTSRPGSTPSSTPMTSAATRALR